MHEYREKSQNEDQWAQLHGANTSNPSCQYDTYLDIAAEYGLENDMDIGNLGDGNPQTVEHEYQAYITGALSPKTVDILRFWEVSDDII